jgi:hypothetical protein
MRSPTVGGYAIANHPHLLTLGRQVIVRFEVLQTNRVLAIPEFYSAAEFAHMVDYPPAATLTPEFGVVFAKDLAHFSDLVSIGYLGSLHNPLHHIFDDSTSWHFPASNLHCLLPCSALDFWL